MLATKLPRPPVPGRIDLVGVSPGDDAFGDAGDYAPADGNVVVMIENDPLGLFTTSKISIFDVERDPDGGNASILVPAGSVDGAGPVGVVQGEAVLARIRFRAPQKTTQLSFSATAVISGDTWPVPVSIPVTATIAGISVTASERTLRIAQGGKATAHLQVTSLGGPETVEFVMFAGAQGIHIEGGSVRISLNAGQTLPFPLTFQANPDATLGVHELQGLAFRTLDRQVQRNLDHFLTFDVLFANDFDDSVEWAPASNLAIAFDPAQDAWLSGHVNAIVPLQGGAVLVGTDTGGVWGVAGIGEASPHSDDWNNPDVTCLAVGPDGPNHFYAGCNLGGAGIGSLYESEPATAFFEFMHWHDVPLRDSNGAPLLTGGVLCMVVLQDARKIVLGCDKGVFWAEIPQAGGTYSFTMVPFLPIAGFQGAALGPDNTIAIATNGGPQPGFFVGSWSSGTLQLDRVPPINGFDPSQMRRTSIAACDTQRQRMYAVVAGTDDGNLMAILRSDDGGRNWRRLAPTIAGSSQRLDGDHAGPASHNGGYNNCIAVAPFDPDRVAIGWANGPWISQDGGSTWDRGNSENDHHMHADLHALAFDPADPSGRTLFVGSDGGLSVTRDLGGSYANEQNQHLLTLQLAGLPGFTRQYYGLMSATSGVPGLVGAGLQDNGIVYAHLGSGDDAWRQIIGADGNLMLFVATGHALFYNGDEPNDRFIARQWNGTELANQFVVPIRRVGPEGTSTSTGLAQGVAAAVTFPTLRRGQQLMYAVACADRRQDLYGLFANDDGSDLHWDYLDCSLPPKTSEEEAKVSALDTLDGSQIFVGTKDGRIFATSPTLTEMNVPVRANEPGQIWRIRSETSDTAYALYNRNDGVTGRLLQLNGNRWDTLGTSDGVAQGFGLPAEEGPFYGFDVDFFASPSTLFLSTDNHIYVSRDKGNSWKIATKGLPLRPHCSLLNVVAHNEGKQRFLYLGTWGRSLWRAVLA